MSIIIFSKPVHSGKTTALLEWSKEQKNIAGILMPDMDGERKMFDIRTNEIFDAECKNADDAKATDVRFLFDLRTSPDKVRGGTPFVASAAEDLVVLVLSFFFLLFFLLPRL